MAHAPHKYLHAFVAEATEQLEQLASELVRIEQEPLVVQQAPPGGQATFAQAIPSPW